MRFLKEFAKGMLYRPFGVTMGVRSFLLRPFHVQGRACVRIGERTSFLPGSFLHAITEYAGRSYRPAIEFGNDVYVGRQVFVTAIDRVSIGDGCVLSDHVYITDEVHGTDPAGPPIMQQPLFSKGPVVIGECCFLGYRSAILPGVTLGHHCVVGANATVTRSFPPYSMVAGSPARIIKRYSADAAAWVACGTPPEA